MNPLTSIKATLVLGVLAAVLIGLGTAGVRFNPSSFVVWLHVLSGITWLGLLYYFTLVETPALAEAAADIGGPGGSGISRYIAPRASAWLRWAAIATWITGVAELGRAQVLADTFALGLLNESLQDRYLGIGVWLGTIMLFNVWIIIRPSQRKTLGLVEAGAVEVLKARRRVLLASRANAALSIPLVMSMVAYGHGGFFI